MKNFVRMRCISALRFILIFFVRPYVSRELPGWGKVYTLFIQGNGKYDWLWENAKPRTIRGKFHGYLMRLDLSFWPDRSAFFLKRWYQLEIQLLLFDLVHSNDTVVDIGANRGMFTLIASRLVGDGGKVISFEPNPNCLKVLDQAIADNQITNIEVNRCGLAAQAGEFTLSVPLSNWGEATFGKTIYNDENIYKVQVPVKIGDEILKEETPSLIKIDVEGFEYNVIQGLSKTIEKHHPVIITEVVARHLEACDTSVQELSNLIEGFGYVGFKLDLAKKGSKHDWQLVSIDPTESDFDVVWLHQDFLKSQAPMLMKHRAALKTQETD